MPYFCFLATIIGRKHKITSVECNLDTSLFLIYTFFISEVKTSSLDLLFHSEACLLSLLPSKGNHLLCKFIYASICILSLTCKNFYLRLGFEVAEEHTLGALTVANLI